MRSVVFLLACLFSFTHTHALQIRQNWTVAIRVGEDGGPCKQAVANLVIALEKKRILEFAVPLEAQTLGIGTYSWEIELSKPGHYTLQARLRGCDGKRLTSTALPLSIDGPNETRAIYLLGGGDEATWRFTYFGVTTEKTGAGVLTAAPGAPVVLTNVSSRPLRPCRKTFWPHVQVLELVDGQWLNGMQYAFREDLAELQPGATTTLEEPRAIVIRGKAPDEPAPAGYGLKVLVEPDDTHFEHLIPVEGSGSAGAAGGFCDAYYVDYVPQVASEKPAPSVDG